MQVYTINTWSQNENENTVTLKPGMDSTVVEITIHCPHTDEQISCEIYIDDIKLALRKLTTK